MTDTNKLLDTTDAQAWAKAFCERFTAAETNGSGWVDDPEGLMLSWFASAIETGRSAGQQRGTTLKELQAEALANSRRWFPTLHRQDPEWLLMYMALGVAEEAGEVAGATKKLMRHVARLGWDGEDEREAELMTKVRTEMGDTLAYLMILADLTNTDLVEEYRTKAAFNETREWAGGNG